MGSGCSVPNATWNQRARSIVCAVLSTLNIPPSDTFGDAVATVEETLTRFESTVASSSSRGKVKGTLDVETKIEMKKGGLNPDLIRGDSNCCFENNGDFARCREEVLKSVIVGGGVSIAENEMKAARHVILGHLVRISYECRQDHNIGAVVLKNMFGTDGHPIVLFRSQVMPFPGKRKSAFRDLLDPHRGRVRHVFNIYSGHFPVQDWLDEEMAICAELRTDEQCLPSYHDERRNGKTRRWRRMIDEFDEWTDLNRRNAMILCARQIRDILRPQGHAPSGNILVHCCGGMHRTGMIVGIIRRYVNDDPIESVLDDYRRHVDWKSAEHPGGAEELNMKFIKDFDLNLLKEDANLALESGMIDDEGIETVAHDEWGVPSTVLLRRLGFKTRDRALVQ